MDKCPHCKEHTIHVLTSKEKVNHYAKVAGLMVYSATNPIGIGKNLLYNGTKSLVHSLQGYKYAKKLYKCNNCHNFALICPHCKFFTIVGLNPPLYDSLDIFVCGNCHEKFLWEGI